MTSETRGCQRITIICFPPWCHTWMRLVNTSSADGLLYTPLSLGQHFCQHPLWYCWQCYPMCFIQSISRPREVAVRVTLSSLIAELVLSDAARSHWMTASSQPVRAHTKCASHRPRKWTSRVPTRWSSGRVDLGN